MIQVCGCLGVQELQEGVHPRDRAPLRRAPRPQAGSPILLFKINYLIKYLIINPCRQDSRRFNDAYQHGFFLRDAGNLTRDANGQSGNFSTFNYTIMATGDSQDDGDGRILYFSTPIDTGRGRGVFGTDQDDNRRKHIETR